MKAYVTVGVSGSGKSTWARAKALETGCIITNRDDLRFSLTGATGWHEYKFSNKVEEMVNKLQTATMNIAYLAERDIIVADTNLNSKVRKALIKQLEFWGFEVEIVEFPISFQEAHRRNLCRGNLMIKYEVLEKQWENWIKYNEEKQNEI